ncbi:UDP-N-acetylmuramyl peptide synthase [Bifidobacterium choerinum]|uniref:UDP-N-acetylmuramyl peptide synthase n=1 Tax=Bifidobacterium choerinum TaxID=35760 RepID=A0A2D3D237_9BIFI|nr:UDP-N-acetylmuramyl peptide synthase [Bifidobacterium choerinum]ATU19611.1 UDP-N-acetylmuramyl peptide synthase [Bifidobacterium choerinum]
MSAINETTSQRLTLGMLQDRYGYELVPDFARDVTVTSLANDVDSVTPGALYMPGIRIDKGRIALAVRRGAYAVMLPTSMRNAVDDPQVPVLFADPSPRQIGELAASIAGRPSESIAVFAIAGSDVDRVREDVDVLAQFLHMLGNPVGTVCEGDSQSLERFLDLSYPVDAFAMQRVFSVCVEDGAAAIILALNARTIAPGALESVGVDVLGYDDAGGHVDEMIVHAGEQYGCTLDANTHLAQRDAETDAMAEQADFGDGHARALSLAIAMTLAAGVRKTNIRNALRVSKELR